MSGVGTYLHCAMFHLVNCHIRRRNVRCRQLSYSLLQPRYRRGQPIYRRCANCWKISCSTFALLKACCHYQSFPLKTLSKKTWTKCLLSLSKFVDHLCQRIGGKSCKHEKMAPTLTNYENIAVTLCLMSIAILRRRLRDRARVRRRATRSWLLRRKQRIAHWRPERVLKLF
jgi:hypothetical protein